MRLALSLGRNTSAREGNVRYTCEGPSDIVAAMNDILVHRACVGPCMVSCQV